MRDPAFWWRDAGLVAGVLSPVAAFYGAIAGRRMARPGHVCGVPVVCIGNLTLGGTGKTPTAIAVARWLDAAGHKPFLLSRGYGGTLAGPQRVDPQHHRALEVGDEPLLLARAAPTIVARDRIAGATVAQASGAGTIVMDDGLQNPALSKNVSIAVVDGRRGIGNGKVFPAGPLRAPLTCQLERVDALLVVGSGAAGEAATAAAASRGLPVFHGTLKPDETALAELKGRPVLAFAGIGDPEKFFATLAGAGIDVRARLSFADHHRYRADEARDLVARAERDRLVPVTTEKDLARLAGDDNVKALASMARALPVELSVAEEGAFRDFILTRLR
jgi:tetraacyldisaccharide 4'-kinase